MKTCKRCFQKFDEEEVFDGSIDFTKDWIISNTG